MVLVEDRRPSTLHLTFPSEGIHVLGGWDPLGSSCGTGAVLGSGEGDEIPALLGFMV